MAVFCEVQIVKLNLTNLMEKDRKVKGNDKMQTTLTLSYKCNASPV